MLPFHPLANIFPIIEGAEFDNLVADIKTNGLRDQIVLLDGQILDGRNRYRAGLMAEQVPADGGGDSFRQFDPERDGDPLAFVLSKNLARRHLNESQRSMVAARVATMRQGQRTDIAEPSANLPKVAQEKAANSLNVSPRSLRSAKAVQDTGTPELVHAVEQGKLAVSAAAQAAKLSPEQQREVAAQAEAGKANVVRNVIKQGVRNAREAMLGQKQVALPDKKFGVILADPEHRFEVWSRETGLDRAADNHYPTSDQRALLRREIQKIAAKDCLCALWVTDLANGLRMLESWGFEYKSYFVWVKDIVQIDLTPEQRKTGLGDRTFTDIGPAGTGYWNRDRDELLLIGTRGSVPCPAMGTQGESVWFAARPKIEGSERGRHSAKPENAHLWIERHYPTMPKIELNARNARPGWDCWGNEAPESIGNKEAENITENITVPPAMSDDDLYASAVALVVKDQNASTSYVQRHLMLGYNKAAVLVEKMQEAGIVSAPDRNGKRSVLARIEEIAAGSHISDHVRPDETVEEQSSVPEHDRLGKAPEGTQGELDPAPTADTVASVSAPSAAPMEIPEFLRRPQPGRQ